MTDRALNDYLVKSSHEHKGCPSLLKEHWTLMFSYQANLKLEEWSFHANKTKNNVQYFDFQSI